MEIFKNFWKQILIIFLFFNILNAKTICSHSKSSIKVSLYSLKYQLPLEQSENGAPVFLGSLSTIIQIEQSINFLCVNENLAKDIYNVKLYQGSSIKEDGNNKTEIYLKKSSFTEEGMIIYELQRPLICGIYHIKFEKYWGNISLDEKKGIFTKKSILNHFFGTKIDTIDEYYIPFPTIDSLSTRHSFELEIVHPQNTTVISNSESLSEHTIGTENIWKKTIFRKTNNIPLSYFGFFILPSEYRKINYNLSYPSISLYYNWVNTIQNELNKKSINEEKMIEIFNLFKMVNFQFSDEILIKNINIIKDDNFLFNSNDSLNNIYNGIIVNDLKNDRELNLKIILKQFTMNILRFKSLNDLKENNNDKNFIENNINNVIIGDVIRKIGENDYENFKMKKYLEISLKDQLNYFQNYSMISIDTNSTFEKTNVYKNLLSVTNTLLSLKKIIGESIFYDRLKQFVEIYKFEDVDEETFWSMITKGLRIPGTCFCDILKILKYSKSDLILRIETDKESLFSFNFINPNKDNNNNTIPLFLNLLSINGKNNTRKELKLPIQLLTKKIANIGQFKRNDGEVLFLNNLDYMNNYRTFYDYFLWEEIFFFMEKYPSIFRTSEKIYLIETFCYQLSYDGIDNYKNILNDFKKHLNKLPIQPINCIIPSQNI
ncbi:Hypothetical protein SRAE_2000255600 [Strongyloides ratti]|uniref:Uncharacterized protein n=1 Tax=Strongyloides ratti TaxID=34506 RepID=A0A090MYW5_STRRB|nr:Hypothetical protein SRAE_2000255600 [Strongyloides ratti]CEF67894.1 Hypothetical protein SRAE_2000255600 [Strongyloides ratti]